MSEENLKLSRKLAECIQACNNCFEGCLGEEHVKMMVQCIKLDKECAIICGTALQVVHQDGPFVNDILEVCIKACQACADECRKFPEDHCRECSKVCDECVSVCREYLYQANEK